MRHSTLGIRCFGLAIVAALGLMAFMAGAAQAEDLTDGGKAGTIQINKGAALDASVTGAQEGTGILLTAGRNLDIKCTSADVENGLIISGSEGLVVILYLGCKAFVHNTATPVSGCNIVNEDIKATAILLPKKHEGKEYILVEQHKKEGVTIPFTTIEFKALEGCALPLKNNITGSVVAQLKREGGEGIHKVQHLITFSEAIQKLFRSGGVGDKILFGTFESFVKASATVELTGPHTGLTFGIV